MIVGEFTKKKWLSYALICLLLAAVNVSPLSAQIKTDTDVSSLAKIKADVARRGRGENNRVTVKMLDGTRMKGFISQAGEDSFTLTDAKTKQSNLIAYRDVARVKGTGLSMGAKIGIGAAIGAAVILGLIFQRYCNNEQC